MYKANKEGAIDVKTFSMAQLISGKAAEYGRIVLKLDIESGEYEVLQDLMDTGAAQSLVHIFVEFHSRFFSDDQRQHCKDQEIELVRRLRRLGVGVTIWR